MHNKVYEEIMSIFESGKINNDYFERVLSSHEYRDVIEVLAKIFIEHKNDKTKLSIYSEMLSRMSIDNFSYAVNCLVDKYKENNISFPIEEKLEVVVSILDRIKDKESINFMEYKKKLINIISGYESVFKEDSSPL